ncbi:MAG TPA: HemK/PrmC family methyltransferase, partial [Azospirillaceae bacterium]|nr:HemK/PrmC family methyltransferase [Azospirillaceae bacterium]
APLRLLDLGTGSGCILLALLSELPAARGVGVDLSPAAAAAARRNADRLGLGGRAAFLAGDWATALGGGGFDVVVSNPPYIPDADIPGLAPEVTRHDPLLALAGGADGLDCYRALAPELPRLLRPGGLAAVEHGAGQGAAVAALFAATGLMAVERLDDLGGHDRVVVARAPG